MFRGRDLRIVKTEICLDACGSCPIEAKFQVGPREMPSDLSSGSNADMHQCGVTPVRCSAMPVVTGILLLRARAPRSTPPIRTSLLPSPQRRSLVTAQSADHPQPPGPTRSQKMRQEGLPILGPQRFRGRRSIGRLARGNTRQKSNNERPWRFTGSECACNCAQSALLCLTHFL